MLRWGVLSTAKIGREHLVPAIQQARNANIIAVASRNIDQAKSFAREFGIPTAYGSYDELLASPDVDAVYIPLPSSHHVEWSIKAADAGKHVLCEKPISMHASEIDSIIEARNRNRVLVTEAFMVTYHPQWHKVRELISAGEIGTLKHVQAAFSYYNVDPNNMRNVLELGGGALPDIGVYPTVTTRFATGMEPKRISATVHRDRNFGTDTYATARVDFGDFEMTMYVATQLALRQEISFHGDKGWIELSAPFNAGLYDADTVTVHNASHTQAKRYRFPGVNQYKLQVEAVSASILDGNFAGNDVIFSLENSVLNQKLIDAAYRAGESGDWEAV